MDGIKKLKLKKTQDIWNNKMISKFIDINCPSLTPNLSPKGVKSKQKTRISSKNSSCESPSSIREGSPLRNTTSTMNSPLRGTLGTAGGDKQINKARFTN